MSNSHDHIQEIQKITGGKILVAAVNDPSIAELSFYTPGCAPAYFVNCVFPPDILNQERRVWKYSLKPGFRHDITLDFEKKLNDVKNPAITNAEKKSLLSALKKLPWVAWAGKTPHGVHAGVYFKDWTEKKHSGRILDWIMDELAAAGYSGTLELDWSPSVNINRPSRFLNKFDFWRPSARLDASLVTTAPAKSTPKKLKAKKTTSGSLKDQATRQYALYCRAYMLTADETAVKVGKPVAWVNQVWASEPQTAFNTFNVDLGRYVGPRSPRGLYRQNNFHWKPELYRNAGWSWEWCWSQKMSPATAKKHVFIDPQFDELLKLLNHAYDLAVKLNGGFQVYKSWREWVEADIDRCFIKFGFGGLKPATIQTIKNTIVNECIAAGNNHTSISHIARAGPHHSKDIVKKAFAALGLVKKGSGYNSYYPVPSAWLPAPAPVLAVPPPHQAHVANAMNITAPAPVVVKPLTLDAFWDELAKPVSTAPAPVPDFTWAEITRLLAPAFKKNPDWERFTEDKPDAPDYRLDDLLDLVRKVLTVGGHVYHPVGDLLAVLHQVLNKTAPRYLQWLLDCGHIVVVSPLVADTSTQWLAWRETLLGETRFAWRVVEHCWHGNALEIITGEPGTGKTEALARRLVSVKGKCIGGSSQNNSAGQLEARIKNLGGSHKVKTIHKAYKIVVPVHRKGTGFMRGDLFYGDELGQLACEPAGVMAMRWKPGAEVVLSVGVGQNLPVGAGAVGDDLVSWAERLDGQLPTLKLNRLTKNFRLQGKQGDTDGIVRAFQAVGLGKLPVAGSGLEIDWCKDESEVSRKVAMHGKALGAVALMPTKFGVSEVNYGVMSRNRVDGEEIPVNEWEFQAGEKLLVKHGGRRARKAGLRKGDLVEVAADFDKGYMRDALIEVWKPDGRKIFLEMREVERSHGRTGHDAQGLESDFIVVGINTSRAATRRWLYTALSRCRKKCVLVCTREGLKQCVKSNPQRRTLLPVLLDRAFARFQSAAVTPSVTTKPVAKRKRRKLTSAGGDVV